MSYEAMTPKAIRDAIIDNTGADVVKTEGTFVADMAAGVALEMSKLYGALDALLQAMFINTEEYTYLEARAAEYGITRKPGARAAGTIAVTGTVGALLPEGAIVQTAAGLNYKTDSDLTLAGTTGTVTVTAMGMGDEFNTDAHTITTLLDTYSGITAVTNAQAITGGVDEETDDALRERMLNRLQTAPTSGNAYHYKMWALEVDGVGAAKVTPLANGAGTVGVLIVDSGKAPPTPEIITACAAHIEEMRPIGATVTVSGAQATEINVTATVTVIDSAVLADVKTEFEAAVDEYLKSIAFDAYTVSLAKIGYILMGIDGVADYSALTLNGTPANVTLPAANVPMLGGVTLNESV